MFEQMLLPTGGTHVGRNTVIAFAAQLGAVAILTVAMMYFDVVPFPFPQPAIPLYLAPPPPPPPPAAATRAPVQTAVKTFVPRTFVLPTATPAPIPQHDAIIAEAPPSLPDMPGAGVAGGVPGGVPGGVLGGSLNGALGAFAAPPSPTPKPAPPPATPSPIRVGGEVQAALLKHEVVPVYPIIAKSARIQGTVRLSASIAPNGTVKDLRVLSGNPLLVDAAQNAVKQWTYQPTYLNGKPVEVLTEIDVQFTLS
jgi:periplasmic protein TonB